MTRAEAAGRDGHSDADRDDRADGGAADAARVDATSRDVRADGGAADAARVDATSRDVRADGGAADADSGAAGGDGSEPSGGGGSADAGTALCELLADERTRAVLSAVAGEALPVKEVASRSGVSTATVYRRVDDLVDHDLLAAETRVDADGNHYTAYRSKVERVVVEVDPGAGRVTVDLSYRDAADQFVHLWEGLGE